MMLTDSCHELEIESLKEKIEVKIYEIITKLFWIGA